MTTWLEYISSSYAPGRRAGIWLFNCKVPESSPLLPDPCIAGQESRPIGFVRGPHESAGYQCHCGCSAVQQVYSHLAIILKMRKRTFRSMGCFHTRFKSKIFVLLHAVASTKQAPEPRSPIESPKRIRIGGLEWMHGCRQYNCNILLAFVWVMGHMCHGNVDMTIKHYNVATMS